MKATVCELPDARDEFSAAWSRLVEHVRDAASTLVLLPEMPFASWFAGSRRFDSEVWNAAVRAHDEWEHRLFELGPAYALSSRPIDFGNERWDEGFVWDAEHGLRSVHAKAQFRNQEHAWESTWYSSTWPEFVPLDAEGVHIGFLMGAELAMADEARRYGAEQVDVIAVPRGANIVPFDDWQARARELALLSGAYLLSSTRSGAFGGQGCIISPAGEMLGVTSASQPFFTHDLDLAATLRRAADLHTEASRSPLDPFDPLDTGVPPY